MQFNRTPCGNRLHPSCEKVEGVNAPSCEGFAVQGEVAMTLSPHYPAAYLGHLGNAYRLAGRVEEAITAFKAYNARNPGFGLVDMVIAYQQTNRPEEAKATAEQLLSIRQDFTTSAVANTRFFRADRAQLETDIAALHAAGLPVN